MKKIMSMALGLCFALQLSAQEKPMQQEIGLVFSNLNNFGFTYRIGTEQALWRFNTLLLNGRNDNNYTDSADSFNSQFATSLSVGREYRKFITPKLSFRYGMDVSASFQRVRQKIDDKRVANNDQTNTHMHISPGLNAVLGFNYALNNNIVLGAEALPFVAYQINIANNSGNPVQNSPNSQFFYGLSSTGIQLSLVYQF